MKYEAHDYQKYATEFILTHPTAAVLLEMGLGKSVITLTAIQELCMNRFEVSRVLVIAPLRVARDTWPAEIEKWDHLQGLTYSVAVGTEAERRAALMENTTVHIINRENVAWLVEKSGIALDYDMIVIDELSSFKSYSTKRFRALMKLRPRVKRIVGLTGTPSSNGLMDLWAEFRLLDLGKRLGRYITHYREEFFVPDKRSAQQIFSYKPRIGAEEEIYRRIGDITISMRSVDHLKMPEMVNVSQMVTLTVTQQELYDQMRREMVAELDDAEIDAVNAASLSNKLMQMANGAIYDEDKNVHHIHDQKGNISFDTHSVRAPRGAFFIGRDSMKNPFSGLFRARDKPGRRPSPQNALNGSAFSFMFGRSAAGKLVNERSAMQLSAVYACVRVLSEAIASMPLHFYRYNDTGGTEKATDHPLYRLLHDEPNPEMSAYSYRVDWADVDEVPETVRLAVLLMASHFYEYRDSSDKSAYATMMSAFQTLLYPNRKLEGFF